MGTSGQSLVPVLLLILVGSKECVPVAAFPGKGASLFLPLKGDARITGEVARRLVAMYQEELLLKRTIVGELAHTTDHDLTLTYLSLWLHQPCIRSDSKLLLESMLLETGHRAL